MDWNNAVTRRLKISYPIVQAPMLGITSPAMVAAISEAGGLGSLLVGGLSSEQTRTLIRAVKALTNKPFSVNLFAYDAPEPDTAMMLAMQQFLATSYNGEGYSITDGLPPLPLVHPYQHQVPVLLEEDVEVVSFTSGIPDKSSIGALKAGKVLLMGTATCLEEALALQEQGVDIITAQGAEAGGHRGTFADGPALPLIGTMALVPLLVKNLSVPVLAAGGIADGTGIRAAMMLGAAGVQVGSAFLRCNESLAPAFFKELLPRISERDVVVTRALTGRWARGISNRLIRDVESSGLPIPAYPYQNLLVMPIRVRAQELSDPGCAVMWAGQAANRALAKPASDIFNELVHSATLL